MSKNINETSKPELLKKLGLFDSTMMVIGIVVGSGIFVTTGLMAESLPSPILILAAWAIGGLITLFGALTYGELGAMMPEAGGQYVYLKKAFGPLVGFLFGWINFAVYYSGATAATAVIFAEICSYFIPWVSSNNIIVNLSYINISISSAQLFAVFIIVLVSIYNFFGLELGKTIQNVFTILKVGSISIFIFGGFLFGNIQPIDFTYFPAELTFAEASTGFITSLILVFWAFDGWNVVTNASSEYKNPGRNIPYSLIYGTVIITVIYLLMNLLYLATIPITEMGGVINIAERSSAVLFDNSIVSLLIAIIAISIFGSLNASIILSPRLYYAMAKDKLFFAKVGEIHPKYKTPGYALVLQCFWASVLALSGTFGELLTFAMFVAIVSWIAVAFSIFKLRKDFPEIERPYKTWGYPWVPVVFIAMSTIILINTLYNYPIESLAGVVITIMGIPIYYYWNNKYGPTK